MTAKAAKGDLASAWEMRSGACNVWIASGHRTRTNLFSVRWRALGALGGLLGNSRSSANFWLGVDPVG
jgi:hypothetical protein